MDQDKYIDESWKEAVTNDKDLIKGSEEPSEAEAEGNQMEAEDINFLTYISSLAFQAMIFLGEMPNPMTNKEEKNLRQAKFIINTLILLRDKTKGNLTKEESDMLNAAAYELEMRFVELASKEQQS